MYAECKRNSCRNGIQEGDKVLCKQEKDDSRITPVIALSVPPERRYYGGHVYSHVYAALIDALKSTKKVNEFSEFKYRNILRPS